MQFANFDGVLVMVLVLGTLADTIAANRKFLEDVQYHDRKREYERDNR